MKLLPLQNLFVDFLAELLDEDEMKTYGFNEMRVRRSSW